MWVRNSTKQSNAASQASPTAMRECAQRAVWDARNREHLKQPLRAFGGPRVEWEGTELH